MLLATDDIDQAQEICDNIGILVNGKIICYGTPTFLSRAYGGSHEFTLYVDIHKSDYLMVQNEIFEQLPESTMLMFQGYSTAQSDVWQMTFKIIK